MKLLTKMKRISLPLMGMLLFLTPGKAAVEINDVLTISGWIDMLGSSQDVDGAATSSDSFAIEEVEVDFFFDFHNGLTARFDMDSGDGRSSFAGDGEDFAIEQANFNYKFADGFSVTGGKFLSAIGWESYDAINLYQISVSATLVSNGHVTYPGMMNGAALDYSADKFKIYGAVLSGVFDNQDTDLDEFGYEAQLCLMPVEGLTIKTTYATEKRSGGMGLPNYDQSIFNIWASYKYEGLLLAVEYNDLQDQGAKGIDGDGFLVMGNYAFNDKFSLTLRHSALDLDDGTDSSEVTISPSYICNENLVFLLEYRSDKDDGIGPDSDTFAVEALVTF